ncbi:hypothetical protein K501DRAFT_335048 [Backusella circina FSU 941]|nr:hypothetical protein K501DRAFT_335048 [Backusella circina FSU 941]
MPSLTPSELPLYVSDLNKCASSSTSVPSLSMPTSFRLFDISEDNKFLALIDDNFMLQVYELNQGDDEKQIKRQTMKDIPCDVNCKNVVCVYISVASETGHVAISFLQMNGVGEAIKKRSLFDKYKKYNIFRKKEEEEEDDDDDDDDDDDEDEDEENGENEQTNEKEGEAVAKEEEEEEETLDKKFTNCKIYRENESKAVEMPLQGKATFTKNRLLLVGRWVLEVYDAKTLKKMYSFKPGSFYLDNYADFDYSIYYQAQNWCYYHVPTDGTTQELNDGYGIANISAHVRQNVIVAYDEDTDAYPDSSTKIWSISTGSLICSFMRDYRESVISISEDHRFLVTNDPNGKALNIYCMKTGTRLHAYLPQALQNSPDKTTIMRVKIMKHQDYMLIMGTTTKQNQDAADESRYLFFEIFSIAQKKRVKYVESDVLIDSKLMFPVDIIQKNYSPNSSDPLVYFPSQFFGVFLEKTDKDKQHLTFRKIPLVNPESTSLISEKLWDTFSCQCISGGNWESNDLGIFSLSFTSDNNVALYLLKNDSNMFLLRFSSFQVQLWRLETAGIDEKELFNLGTPSSDNLEKPIHTENLSKSSLIYTRFYYGRNYKESSAKIGILKAINNENNRSKPYVHFTGDKGRILVYVQLQGEGQIVDEIFLPLSELKSKIVSDSLGPEAPDSGDITENVPKDDFHGLESCLLALVYLYWADNYPTKKKANSLSLVEEDYTEIVKKTEKLMESLISAIDITIYFQTMTASNILMELAHSDDELDSTKRIINTIVEKDLPIKIYNYTTNENGNQNILTFLIENNKLELFQILFNQVVLDYYNGSSVDLFPLMDALLCLHKNKMPGVLLKCVDVLSYLPVNLPKTGLLEWEFNTLGDQKSFNSFTAFHQMRKHYSSFLSATHPRRTKVSGKAIDDTERYFDSHRICLIPLPTPSVYDTISHAILDKDSTYSKTDSLNETFKQEIPIVEVLLTHKWRKHIQGSFYIILFFQVLFYMLYTVSVSFPEEIFGYTPGSTIQHRDHLVCLIITALTWILFVTQEVKQIIALKWEYWKSPYNYVDLLAAIFPLVSLILMLTDAPHLYDISSLSTLILWIHFLLRLRVNRRMGILIEIIIQLGVKIAPIIGLMILLIIAFTHSFAVLLRRQDDSFFQEHYGGSMTPGSDITLSDQSQQNLFKDVFLAFSTVWFFLYGIFDPIFSGDVGNYPMALVLAILFSFITSLIILNVVIALMTGAIDETEKKGNRNWHIHLADVSGEIENLLPWFIEKGTALYVYYHATKDDVKLQHEKIENETKKLKERFLKEKLLKEKSKKKERGKNV